MFAAQPIGKSRLDTSWAVDRFPHHVLGFSVRCSRKGGIDRTTKGSDLIQHLTLPDAWEGWFAEEGIDRVPGRDGPRDEVMSMALNATVAGLGIALLPSYMADDLVSVGKHTRLSNRTWRYPKSYYLVYPEAFAHMNALQIFRHRLLDQY